MGFESVSDFKKVYVLKTIQTEGSFRKAARKLGVTPSAVSQSISSLEKAIGKSLIIRDKNKTQLTNEANALIEKATPAFGIIEDILSKEETTFQIKFLDLGTIDNLAINYLPQFIKNLRKEHPGFKLNVIIGRSASLINKLKTGELCTTLLIETEEMDSIKKEVIASDTLGVFVSREFEEKANKIDLIHEIGLGSISGGPHGQPIYYKKFLNSLDDSLKPSVLSDSFETLLASVKMGAIASILPKRVASKYRDELIDITEEIQTNTQEKGEHNIILGFMDRCDEREAMYLAKIFRDQFDLI